MNGGALFFENVKNHETSLNFTVFSLELYCILCYHLFTVIQFYCMYVGVLTLFPVLFLVHLLLMLPL